MHVLLIHGLGRTPLSLALLRRRLRRQGHTLHSFGYAAWREPFEQITRRAAIRRCHHGSIANRDRAYAKWLTTRRKRGSL
jgi:hypothetical protein